MYAPDDFLLASKPSDEYTLTLEYQLQRQKQKNKILEERIKNKQIFIAQMKEMQIELDELTQKCRGQLQDERKKREQLEKVELRNYLEKISQLEHEISLLRNRNNNEMEPYKKFFTNEKINPSASLTSRQLKNNRSNKNLKKPTPEFNMNTQADDQKNATRARFVNHFLEMVQVYIPDIKEQNDKKQLKVAWRWIKDVVKEWDEQKNDMKELEQFFQKVKQFVGLDNDEGAEQILEALYDLKQNSNEFESRKKLAQINSQPSDSEISP